MACRWLVCSLAVMGLVWTARPGLTMPNALAQAPGIDGNDPPELPLEALPPAEQPTPPMPAAKPAPAPATAAAQPWQPRAIAEIAALNKIDDRSATLNVPVGQTIQFEHLSIAVRACVVRPPDQAPNAAAFLQIANAQAGTPGFSGWMLAAEPSVSMLRDPAYDVRVVTCR